MVERFFNNEVQITRRQATLVVSRAAASVGAATVSEASSSRESFDLQIGAYNGEFVRFTESLGLREHRLTNSWTDEKEDSFVVFETFALKRDVHGDISLYPTLDVMGEDGFDGDLSAEEFLGVTVPPVGFGLESLGELPADVYSYFRGVMASVDVGSVRSYCDYGAYEVWRFGSFALQRWQIDRLIQRILVGRAFVGAARFPSEAVLSEPVFDVVRPPESPLKRRSIECFNPPTFDQVAEVKNMVLRLALEHGVDSRKLLDVCSKESEFNPWARNSKSGARGLFQFVDRTWEYACGFPEFRGRVLDVWDPYDNCLAAIALQKREGWSPWVMA